MIFFKVLAGSSEIVREENLNRHVSGPFYGACLPSFFFLFQMFEKKILHCPKIDLKWFGGGARIDFIQLFTYVLFKFC